MKGIIILCMSLIFLAMGTAISLAVFQLDGSTSGIEYSRDRLAASIPGSSEPTVTPALTASIAVVDMHQQASTALFTNRFFSWVNQSFQKKTANYTDHQALEPTLIFLFGAGIFGLASFSRRYFIK